MESSNTYWMTREVLGFYFDKGKASLAICNALERLNPSSIFEFGCGTGRNLYYAMESNPSIKRAVGIDINPQMVSMGMAKFNGVSLSDSGEYEYGESFDICFTASALTHIDDLGEVKRIIGKLLNTCEKLILLEPFTGMNVPAFPEYTVTPYTYFWDYKTILRKFGYNDFEVTDSPLCEKETVKGVGRYYKLLVVKS